MPVRTSEMSTNERMFINLTICLYLVITAGGMYQTVTHENSPIFPVLSQFSYGMLAPFQGDSNRNAEIVIVAESPNGTTQILPVRRYFQGQLGERTSRSLLEQLKDQDPVSLREVYEPMLAQMLQHEREHGHAFTTLRLYKEEWTKSALGYEALRTRAVRTFLASVQ